LAVDVKSPPYGNLLQPQVYAERYYHFFAVRIDADIDGLANTVSVEDLVSVDPPNNPYGNGLQLNKTDFTTAGESPSPQSDCYWRISNPNSINSVNGRGTSWKLGSYRIL